MKRRWPLGIVSYEKGYSDWLDSMTPAYRNKILKSIVSRGKKRTHKRERREGKMP